MQYCNCTWNHKEGHSPPVFQSGSTERHLGNRDTLRTHTSYRYRFVCVIRVPDCPCAPVRPCAPCVSRVCPGSPRYLFTGTGTHMYVRENRFAFLSYRCLFTGTVPNVSRVCPATLGVFLPNKDASSGPREPNRGCDEWLTTRSGWTARTSGAHGFGQGLETLRAVACRTRDARRRHVFRRDARCESEYPRTLTAWRCSLESLVDTSPQLQHDGKR